MALPIERDLERFRQIVRGKVRQNLRKFIQQDNLIGRKGDKTVSIPIPEINLPKFRFGDPRGGIGQGEGDVGEVIGQGQEPGESGDAGSDPGRHILEVDFSIDELAEMLGEELELPNILPKNSNNVTGEVCRYRSIRRVGPDGMLSFKRTYLEALKRMIMTGEYNPTDPVILPIQDDRRYRSWKYYPYPDTNALVFLMRDISGSMDSSKTRLVRMTCFWIDLWLRHHYKKIVNLYIVHDTDAAEVDQEKFFSLRVDGGTYISSAFNKSLEIINDRYPPAQWNIYGYYFGDGENWGEDTENALSAMQKLLAISNAVGYAQVKTSGYWTGGFMNEVAKLNEDNLLRIRIDDDDDVYIALRVFFGKGL